MRPDRGAERTYSSHRPQRSGDRVDEDRDHRLGGGVPEELLQRLHGAVVDIHRRGDRDVDVGVENCSGTVGGEFSGYVEGTLMGAVVAHTRSRGADAERRHRPVEEAVVVVGRERDDELGIEGTDEVASGRDGRLDVVKELL